LRFLERSGWRRWVGPRSNRREVAGAAAGPTRRRQAPDRNIKKAQLTGQCDPVLSKKVPPIVERDEPLVAEE